MHPPSRSYCCVLLRSKRRLQISLRSRLGVWTQHSFALEEYTESMGWAVGYDSTWKRDIGYGVPSICDHPDCSVEINRGLSYVCGSQPYGGDKGCGMYFCGSHLMLCKVEDELVQLCERCRAGLQPFVPKPDTAEWINHKATDPSWAEWQASHSTTEKG